MSSTAPPPTIYLPTVDAYNQWAETYDTSPNFLPPLSTQLFRTLLAPLLPTLPPNPVLVDLGCGTGRTTTLLLSHAGVTVVGLDASPAMLAVARPRCEAHWQTLPPTQRADTWSLELWDLLAAADDHKLVLGGRLFHAADLVASTLVLEHIPAADFFRAAAALLRPGGCLVLTNMHAHMGRVTQAGFRTSANGGAKVRGRSFAHEIADVRAAALQAGFEQAGELVEVGVCTEDLEAGEGDGGALGEWNAGARRAAEKWHATGKHVLFGGVWRFGAEG